MSAALNRLPNEMIGHLFSFLDRKSLFECLRVYKKFKDLIELDLKIMARLPLTVKDGMIDNDFLNSNRRYTDVKLIEVRDFTSFEGLKSISNSIVKALIKKCTFPRFVDVMKCFPNIRQLEIRKTNELTADNSDTLDPAMFSKLNDLEIHSSSVSYKNFSKLNVESHLNFLFQVLKFFTSFKFKYLLVKTIKRNDWPNLLNLLQNQDRMEELQLLKCEDFPGDLELAQFSPNFYVKYLKLDATGRNSSKLLDFLLLFKDKMLHFTISGMKTVTDPHLIYDAVTKNFQSLEIMEMQIHLKPAEVDFYEFVETNRKLRSLTAAFFDIVNNSIGFQRFFKTYRNVKELCLILIGIGENITADDFHFANEQLKNVKRMFCIVNDSTSLKVGFIKNLTALGCDALVTDLDWTQLASECPNLIYLILGQRRNCNFDLTILIKSLKNLKSLSLGQGFSITKDDIKMINETSVKLENLSLMKECWIDDQTVEEVTESLNIKRLAITFVEYRGSFYNPISDLWISWVSV